MTPSSTPLSSRRPVIQNASDRRGAQRAKLGVSVTITVAGKLVDALGVDVSAGGMRVVGSQPARVGDEVSLVFFLNGDIVSGRGVVRWCTPTERGNAMFGVRFTAIDEDGPLLVATYCRSAVS